MPATFTDTALNITTAVSPSPVNQFDVDRPTDVVDGDLMKLYAVGDGTAGFNLPSGWTELVRTTNGTVSGMIAERVASSEPTKYTISFTSGSDELALCIMRITGAPGTSPIDAHSSSVGTSIVAADITEGVTPAEGVTTGVDDELCIDVIFFDDDDDNANEHVPGHATKVNTGFTNGFLASGDGSGQCMMGISTFVQASAGATPSGSGTEAEQWLIDGPIANSGVEDFIKATIAIKTAAGGPSPRLLKPAIARCG